MNEGSGRRQCQLVPVEVLVIAEACDEITNVSEELELAKQTDAIRDKNILETLLTLEP